MLQSFVKLFRNLRQGPLVSLDYRLNFFWEILYIYLIKLSHNNYFILFKYNFNIAYHQYSTYGEW